MDKNRESLHRQNGANENSLPTNFAQGLNFLASIVFCGFFSNFIVHYTPMLIVIPTRKNSLAFPYNTYLLIDDISEWTHYNTVNKNKILIGDKNGFII